jgi:hypothetical protein
MLVDVPEFVQDPERRGICVLPTNKRLQPLKVCAQTWVDSPEALRLFGATPRDEIPSVIQGVGVEVDREAGVSPLVPRLPTSSGDRVGGRLSLIGAGESPDHMVEGSPEVVDNIANDSPQLPPRGLPGGFTVDDYLSCIRIELGFNFVRLGIAERLHPFLQEAQVYSRPTRLDEMTARRGGHALW